MPRTKHDNLRSDVYNALAHHTETTPPDVFAAALALADATTTVDTDKPSIPTPVAQPATKKPKQKRAKRISGTAGLNTPNAALARANRYIADGLSRNLHSVHAMEQHIANQLHIPVNELQGPIRVLARLRIKTHQGSAARAVDIVPAGLSPQYARACLNFLGTRNYAHRSRITGSNAYAWSYTHPQQPQS